MQAGVRLTLTLTLALTLALQRGGAAHVHGGYAVGHVVDVAVPG